MIWKYCQMIARFFVKNVGFSLDNKEINDYSVNSFPEIETGEVL